MIGALVSLDTFQAAQNYILEEKNCKSRIRDALKKNISLKKNMCSIVSHFLSTCLDFLKQIPHHKKDG